VKIQYIEKNFAPATLEIIEKANTIIDEYAAQGYDLTLRQLYYQFVARDLIPNKQSEYKRLGSIVSDGRLAGLISWESIVDRTRNLRGNNHWRNPGEILRACASQFMVDRWAGQMRRVEVWIEKDALTGVIAGVCGDLDVPFFSCRGYVSQSEAWGAAMRIAGYKRRNGQSVVVLHLGDHDPSGIDMTRDIRDRFATFGVDIEIRRIALNMDQVIEKEPPPNPAKITDSRANGYIAEHGSDSWELDALEPQYLTDLIRRHIEGVLDRSIYDEEVRKEDDYKARLLELSDEWED